MKVDLYEIEFVKMHGAGNDYIYIDCTGRLSPLAACDTLPQLARAVSDRHFGIGGDGMVLIMNSDHADFRMRMFNADGSEAQMCGNASRCVGKYVSDAGLTHKNRISLLTGAGIKMLELHKNTSGVVESVTVDMGLPELAADRVPVIANSGRLISEPIKVADHTYSLTAVNMGNPHGVIFVDHITDEMVLRHGPVLEAHPIWPEKANIEFAEILSDTHLRMRVWERGTGETLACGTGSCAVAVAGVLNNLTSHRVTVDLPGGQLEIDWDEATGHVFMTGPATMVASGRYHLPAPITLSRQ